ncbi:MAG TPA: nuclear transport factor 2 family protein [Candidatus Acidoferrum sp.]|jgi:hypothetical protein|nr:nuclear transport factor 2 family protein [Candidatus Acidoferrum sp.]
MSAVNQMLKKTDEELLDTAYRAFNEREIDKILGLMRPDVDWPNGMEGGRLQGRDSVRQYWLRQWSAIDPRVEPVRFERVDPRRIIVHVHQVVRNLAGEVLVDQMVRHQYALRDGLIERMDIL